MKSRRSSPWFVVGTGVGAVALAVAGGVACDESFPRMDAPTPYVPVDVGPAVGLDVRPVNDACSAPLQFPNFAPNAKVDFDPVGPMTFDKPVDVLAHDGKIYVTEQPGYIRYFGPTGTSAPIFANLFARVNRGSAHSGVLSFAFHPSFADNHYVYVFFTRDHPDDPPPPDVLMQSVVARFESHDNGLTLDVASEKIILTQDNPTIDHFGGKVAFGNDGFLYASFGDGAFDYQRAQNLSILAGKIVRVDVDSGDPYAIPSDNPFAAGGGRPEIYAWGFRNPWRFNFDRPTGDLWVADVGQLTREEVDRVELGKNYGWPFREGKTCFLGGGNCDQPGLTDPIVDHDRSEAVSLTGGVIYRGTKIPELTGKYVYADAGTGKFFAFDPTEPSPKPFQIAEGLRNISPVAFGLDEEGEILVVSYRENMIHRLTTPKPPPVAPNALVLTDCVDVSDPTKPAVGLFPYDVNVAQWNDGAAVTRHLSIPRDGTITVREGQRLTLPPGSVAMRTIRREGRLVETQMIYRRPDSQWDAFSYAWLPNQKQTFLVTEPTDVTLPSGAKHRVDAPATCNSCHSSERGVTLGLTTPQLDVEGVDYGGGRKGNPLATLQHLRMIEPPLEASSYAPLPKLDGPAPVAARARAYLDVQCASCHNGADGSMDLRFAATLQETRTCNAPGKLGTGGTKLLSPGNPGDSQIATSMRTRSAGRMPPAGSSDVDRRGIDVVEEWIRQTTCP